MKEQRNKMIFDDNLEMSEKRGNQNQQEYDDEHENMQFNKANRPLTND